MVLGAVWLLNRPPAPPAAVPEPPAATAPAEPVHTSGTTDALAAASSSSLAVPVQACGFEPAVPAQGEADGRYRLKAAMTSVAAAPAPAAFTSAGREAAGEGRNRDAEVAFIVACRLAASASPAPSVPLADAELELAQHYAAAASTAQDELRSELLARARQLMASSAEGYRAVLGETSSKTRMAQQRAALLEQGATLSQVMNVASTQRGAVMGAAPAPPLDDDLAQLDNDLQRLSAQAGAVTSDPRGFQRRMSQAEASRQACQDDRRCLARWYAQRRKALLDEF